MLFLTADIPSTITLCRYTARPGRQRICSEGTVLLLRTQLKPGAAPYEQPVSEKI